VRELRADHRRGRDRYRRARRRCRSGGGRGGGDRRSAARADARAAGERRGARRRVGAADCGTGPHLHASVRTFDHLRQGPDAAYRRAARRGSDQRRHGGGVGLSVSPAGVRQQCHHHRGGPGWKHRGGHRTHGLVSACGRRRPRRARSVAGRGGAADPHALRVAFRRQCRSTGSADRDPRGVRRAGACERREFQAAVPTGRCARGRGRRVTGGGRRRLRGQRAAGRTDRQDHCAGAVCGAGHLGRHTASHRHQGCAHHRRGQQGQRSTDL